MKSLPKWAKEIKPESSIQSLLCGHFTHPTISDCVAVGNTSIRLFSIKTNQIVEIARYSHNYPISSASIMESSGHSEVYFISNSVLYVLSLNSSHDFEITKKIDIDNDYSFVVCSYPKVCLYDVFPKVAIMDVSDCKLQKFDVKCNKIYSVELFNDRIAILELKNVYQISLYKYADGKLSSVYSQVLTSEMPYRLVSIPLHNAVYILSEDKVSKIMLTENGYVFDPFPLFLRGTDPLIVDITAMGVSLLMMSAEGIIIRYDGRKFERIAEIPGAMAISAPTLTKCLIAVDSNRIIMTDKDMNKICESGNVTFRSASYKKGNFVVASTTTVHSAFYDYGIETERIAEINFSAVPKLSMCGDYIFIHFQERTVVLDQSFNDVTPSFLKNISVERVHANSLSFIFAVNPDAISIYYHGQITTCRIPSTFSVFHHSTIFLGRCSTVECYNYFDSSLSLVSKVNLQSQVAAMSIFNTTNVCIGLFDGTIFIADDDLDVSYTTTIDSFPTSMLNSKDKIVVGTAAGEVLIFDDKFNQLNKYKISDIPIRIAGNVNQIVVQNNKRFYEIVNGEAKVLPPDFLCLDVCNDKSQIALVRSQNKNVTANLLTFHFTNTVLGFHSRVLCEFNGYIDRICAATAHDCYVASIRSPPSLFWSRGNVIIPLELSEVVRSIVEWKANHGGKIVNFWVACTINNTMLTRFLLFTQSKDTKVHTILKKLFNTPITSISIASANILVLSHSSQLVGISLETGSLRKKFAVTTPINGIVATDANSQYVVAASEMNGFFCMKFTADFSLSVQFYKKKPFLGSRIKLVNNRIAVSDRIGGVLIYSLTGQCERMISLHSPVCEMFSANNQVFCCHLCGEMTMINADGTDVEESSISALFSFGHSIVRHSLK